MNQINSHNELIQLIARLAQESPTYEKFAIYIENNYLDIVFLTAEEVAKKANISQGSVSRFCKDLGYRGYNDFARSLQGIFRTELTAPQRLKYNVTDSPGVTEEILVTEIRNIESLSNILGTDEFSKMVDFVAKVDTLYFLSARMPATIIPYAAYILSKFRDNVRVAEPGTTEWNTLYLQNVENTGIVVYGFPRYATELVNKVKELKQLGFRIHLITDSNFCPMVDDCENIIQVSITSSSVFDIYSTPVLFTNLLLKEVSKKIPQIDERIRKIEEYEKNNEIYYSFKR